MWNGGRVQESVSSTEDECQAKGKSRINCIRRYRVCNASTAHADAFSFTLALVLHHVNQRFPATLGSISLSRCTSCSSLNLLRYVIEVNQNYFIFLLFIPGDPTIHRGSSIQVTLAAPLIHR